MGNIKTDIDYPKDLTIHTVSGEITAQELIEEIESYYAGRVTRLILLDFSESSLGKIKADEVAKITKLTKKYSQRRKGGKTALVFLSDVGCGLGRMYDIRQDIEGSQLAHMTFRNKDGAMEWLGEYPEVY